MEASSQNDVNIRINELLKNEYECRMISCGNNFPSINIEDNNLKEVCVLLHHKISISDMCKYFNWTSNEIKSRIGILLKEELIEKDSNNNYIPNCMVISIDEGKTLYKQANRFADKAVRLIKEKLSEIKLKTYRIDGFQDFSFESLSLFILSDVILDFIQIDNVESMFLKSKRTKRNGMNYYYSIQEKKGNDTEEALGIYGNMIRNYGEMVYGLYGNKRSGVNFHTITRDTLCEYFDNAYIEDVDKVKEYLLDELIKYNSDFNYNLDKRLELGFNKLGIMDGKKICIPILNKLEYNQLYEIAEIIKEDYIRIFEDERNKLYSYYKKSQYFEEISFEEYFIWWYHIYYSRVTESLIDMNIIVNPEMDNFSYLVIEN